MPRYKMRVRRFIVEETWMEVEARNKYIAKGNVMLKAKGDDASIEWARSTSSDAFVTGDPLSGPEVVEIKEVS